MKFITVIHRRLREGKTFDDYRKAWFHASGFGAPTTMYTVVNTLILERSSPSPSAVEMAGIRGDGIRKILKSILDIDVKERNASPLDDIIEESIVRHFGLVIAEDDFSPAGPLKYVTPSVDGEHTDYDEFVKMSADLAQLIKEASGRRDRLTEDKEKLNGGY